MRIVDDDEPRAFAEHPAHTIPVEAKMRRLERNVDTTPAGEPDGRIVGVIGGIEDDGFVARADHCLDGGVDRFGAAAGDGELGFRVDGTAAGGDDLGGDRGAQRDAALHGRVLVEAGRDCVADAGGESRIDGVVGKALPHVDRALFGGAARHHGEDRGADVGQFALRYRPEKSSVGLHEKPPRTPVRGACVGRLLLLCAFRLAGELQLHTGRLVDEAETDAFHHRLVLDRAGGAAQFFGGKPRGELLLSQVARIFLRSAGVHGALCLRADLAIDRILVKLSMVEVYQ